MRLGKLDNADLERFVLSKFARTRPETRNMPAIGADCATLDLSDDLVVLSCDPITSASVKQLGRLSVHVSCNDVAAAGAEPVALLVTLLMPPDGTLEQIGSIAHELAHAAQLAHVDVVGGHTEVTDAVMRPVTCTSVIARQNRSAVLRGMRAGDYVVMTKHAALEGTSILADDFADRLTGLPADVLESARDLNRFLSVVPESRIAMRHGAVSMHDVTEGGVLGALWELAYANGCAISAKRSAISILPATLAICKQLSLDPYRLIGSGSLLIACEDGARMVNALKTAGIDSAIIAHAIKGEMSDLDGEPIQEPHADEIYRLYETR